jgi:hypothetical protein
MIRFRRTTLRSKIAVGAAIGAVLLAGAGTAFAYFTTTGSGTASGSVGSTSSASDWGVAFGSNVTYSGGASAIYPGVTESIPVTITNNAKGNEYLSSVSVSLSTAPNSTNSAETDVASSSGTAINGCLASWWTVSVTNNGSGFNHDLAPGGTDSETVALTLNDTNANQNACAGSSPAFTVTAG